MGNDMKKFDFFMHFQGEQPIELKEDLSYDEEPVQILDGKEQVLRNKTIPLIKVLWRHHSVEEATWEPEDQMKKIYRYFSPEARGYCVYTGYVPLLTLSVLRDNNAIVSAGCLQVYLRNQLFSGYTSCMFMISLVEKGVVGRLHAVFRSKLAGSPEGGVT
ncbi:Chromo domain-containing protein [Cucumis melo var. makuwa]|uniref:Chromo domain-containing protein n=1 Tax=Cucumis melo var. makuwa TaxID=1194695 RepID=A0A5D3BRJ6_CUCMM|nr:Chromo domain-containing protein [Cucumis melo var. makuwa]